MAIYDEYEQHDRESKVRYGQRTVVLMQVGSFFEIYAVTGSEVEEASGADIYAIADLCDIVVTRKNKTIKEISRSNHLMAGFPEHAFGRFSTLLVNEGYTVVVVRQVTAPPNPKRAITEVLSPATIVDSTTDSSGDNRFLMVVHADEHMGVGIAMGDVTTGRVCLSELTPGSQTDLLKLLQGYSPRELVVVGDVESEIYKEIASMCNDAANASKSLITLHSSWQPNTKNLQKVAMQNAILGQIYCAGSAGNSILSAIELLGLERNDAARMAFVTLIAFLQQHGESLVYRLREPEWIGGANSNNMHIEYNSAVQLNVVGGDNKNRSLLQCLSRCATPQGSRLFKDWLMNPLCDVSTIRNRQDAIDKLLEGKQYKKVLDTLRGTGDLERWLRRIAIGTLPPSQLPALRSAFFAYASIVELDDMKVRNAIDATIAQLDAIDIDIAAQYALGDIRRNIFKKGVCVELDAIQERIAAASSELESIVARITAMGDSTESSPKKKGSSQNQDTTAKLDFNDRDGHHIVMTKKRYAAAAALGLKEIIGEYVSVPVSASSSNIKLTGGRISTLSNDILANETKLMRLANSEYTGFLEKLYTENQEGLYATLSHIANIDCCATCARNADEFAYCKPDVVDNNGSFVDIKGLRHPILEDLDRTKPYHPNDVQLGNKDDMKTGMLLFGVNASGKSCLMKAVGLAVIMAQSGMYAPASSMQIGPYNRLFTRITAGDDIYTGRSTFTVEMLEFRHILRHADTASLVLGDELCSGTEAISALSIVGAGVKELATRGSTFVFTTHLHDLLQLEEVSSLDNVAVCHMHAYVDEKTGDVVYDRTLRQGNGETSYGIMVCSALRLPITFIRETERIQQKLLKNNAWHESWRPSRYNSAVIVGKCGKCGAAATETHHVVPQAELKQNGIPRHLMNATSNLMPLCEACHAKEHK